MGGAYSGTGTGTAGVPGRQVHGRRRLGKPGPGPAFNGRPVWLPGGPRPVGDPPGGGVVRSLGPACSRARPRPARPAASVAALVRFRPSAASGGLGGWSAVRSVAVAGPPPTDLAHAPSNPLACLFFPLRKAWKCKSVRTVRSAVVFIYGNV